MSKHTKKIQIFKISIGVILLIVLLTIGYFLRKKDNAETFSLAGQADFLKTNFDPTTLETIEQTKESTDTPSAFLIKNFPFASQAPLTNWDELHDEACEEASVILVKYYLFDEHISNELMDQEILKMVDWEMKNWGTHKDLTAAETLKMAQSVYALKGGVKSDGTITKLKQEIAMGHPVIIPTAGRLLGNPNFRSPGPVYHMVVAIGYTEKEIIVQDVGTRNGKQYVYNSQIFLNAWHDWPGDAQNIAEGGKNYLVLKK